MRRALVDLQLELLRAGRFGPCVGDLGVRQEDIYITRPLLKESERLQCVVPKVKRRSVAMLEHNSDCRVVNVYVSTQDTALMGMFVANTEIFFASD
jgi:hypothetical protein